MTTRRGLTLIEALVAMFVAAMGMIGILTLFPLGALQMGQALKDGRCAQAAQQSDGLIRWYWAKHETVLPMTSPIQTAMDRARLATPLASTDQGPSYPVLIDPIGYQHTAWQLPLRFDRVAGLDWFARETVYRPIATAGGGTTYVELLPAPPTPPAPFPVPDAKLPVIRFTILQDDLTYADKSGAPAPPVMSGGKFTKTVERGGRYTWAWLAQRPNNTQRGIVDLKIVVFDQRAPFYSNDLTETRYPSAADALITAKQVTFTPGTTSLAVPYSGVRPPIQRGRWVCDVTLNASGDTTKPLRHANFYRVVSVNEETPNFLYLELENPIRRSDIRTQAYTGTLAVLNGVAEVFDRPSLTPPINP